MIPIDTLDDKSMVEDKTNAIVAQEDLSWDVHQSTKETPREPQVLKVTKEASQVKIASYHHPHHPTIQQSFRKQSGNQQSYVPRWKQRGY